MIDHDTVNLLVADQIEKTFNDGVNSFTPPNDGYSMSNPIDARAGDWFTRTGTETGMIVVTDENDKTGRGYTNQTVLRSEHPSKYRKTWIG